MMVIFDDNHQHHAMLLRAFINKYDAAFDKCIILLSS